MPWWSSTSGIADVEDLLHRLEVIRNHKPPERPEVRTDMPLATLSIDLEARLAGLEAGLDKAARIAQQNADKIQKQFDGLKGIGAGLASSLAAAFSISAITLFVRTTIDGVDALNDEGRHRRQHRKPERAGRRCRAQRHCV